MLVSKVTRVFDASKGFKPITNLMSFVDCTIAKRGNQWQMFAAGIVRGASNQMDMTLFSARLPGGAPLSSIGWKIDTDPSDPTKAAVLAGKSNSYLWDGKGGRHCPSYVKGFDPDKNRWVERIYYAGAAENFSGPYTIGFLEWDGKAWIDQPTPAFTAEEDWEHGSVYEPNLIYHDGKWKMWYVAGSNQEDYLVQGYAESRNGRTGWSKHEIVFPAQEHVFDFCVLQTSDDNFEAVFSRVNVANRTDLPNTGLWWCKAKVPSPKMSDWSKPVRISGPGYWKPVLRYGEIDPKRMFVFCNSVIPNTSGKGMPFYFTIECIELNRPE
ncbi:MAG: hypothetical protein QW782_06685 [Candidatus Bathyarchaeia archaeon]